MSCAADGKINKWYFSKQLWNMFNILIFSNYTEKAKFCSLRRLSQILFRYLFPALCKLYKMETGLKEIRVSSFRLYKILCATCTPEWAIAITRSAKFLFLDLFCKLFRFCCVRKKSRLHKTYISGTWRLWHLWQRAYDFQRNRFPYFIAGTNSAIMKELLKL